MEKKCVSNVITGESNFDEKSVQLPQSFILKEVTSYEIHTLGKFYQKLIYVSRFRD